MMFICTNTQVWSIEHPINWVEQIRHFRHLSPILFTYLTRAGILEQFMGARKLVEIGLSYRPARLHMPAESIPWNQFLGSLKV
jgi:hypothetical protein